ncbi:hypothetical protein [Bdellovibrio sp. NC01]|uniref:hypothetical protein n=1 Tax=Bdellovibrio sp. NC01 TaxID=2220073 RepID=UPI001157DF9D|nr:hypothetical protein [Bdellovibrio sp. NC01]QDK37144.1 hypothetical protein DOE51_05835 [Bdellovibrio sp. NC01]
MKLKVRCPSCAKLYEVESEEILSDVPVFQCIGCDSRFGFEYSSELNLENQQIISAFLVQTAAEKAFAAQQQEHIAEQMASAEMKSCPKCGAMNGRRAFECYSCHVIFERLEGLPEDPSLRAQPSLVRKWKNLLENFENETLHDEFIRSCLELDALRFAIMKYEEIKTAQGGDALCDQMIARINSLMMVGLSQNPVVREETQSARPKWQKYMFWGPYGLSALLVLWGVLSLGHRNLIGVGVALACMTSGLIVMVRGKISLSDFID